MSKKSALKISALAVAIAAAAPLTATAEVSGSLDIANQYLWRGLTLFSGGTVSGSLDYEHESGAYAGIWISSELEDTEYDLYVGYAGEVEALSYDVGVVHYRYSAGGEPRSGGASDGSRFSDVNFQEAYVSLGVADFSLTGYFGFGEFGDGSDNEDNYYVASYGKGKFGIDVGYYDFDDTSSQYGHVDLSYEVIDNLTFTASTIVWEDTDDTFKKEPTFVVAYSFPF